MDKQPNLITRDDTFLGVCEALGQDFGIHANFLRVGFALALFFSPVGTIAAYFALGLIVLATRLIAPDRRAPAPEPAAVEEAAPAEMESEEVQLARAA